VRGGVRVGNDGEAYGGVGEAWEGYGQARDSEERVVVRGEGGGEWGDGRSSSEGRMMCRMLRGSLVRVL
jgi:hypothetical protein